MQGGRESTSIAHSSVQILSKRHRVKNAVCFLSGSKEPELQNVLQGDTLSQELPVVGAIQLGATHCCSACPSPVMGAIQLGATHCCSAPSAPNDFCPACPSFHSHDISLSLFFNVDHFQSLD